MNQQCCNKKTKASELLSSHVHTKKFGRQKKTFFLIFVFGSISPNFVFKTKNNIWLKNATQFQQHFVTLQQFKSLKVWEISNFLRHLPNDTFPKKGSYILIMSMCKSCTLILIKSTLGLNKKRVSFTCQRAFVWQKQIRLCPICEFLFRAVVVVVVVAHKEF